MSAVGDLTNPQQPFTRRERRDQERLTAAPAAPDLETALPAESEQVVAPAAAAPAPAAPAPAAPAAAPAVAGPGDAVPVDAASVDFLLALSNVPVSTTSTEIPLQSRASLRAEEHAARTGSPRRPRVATPRLADPEVPFAPTRAFVPAPNRGAAPPQARAGSIRKLAAKGVTVAAMAFVALMAVSTSLPAEALLSSSDVQAAAFEAQRPAQTEPTQTLELAGGDTITVERDGYESSTIAEIAAASGIRMESTFTNNPNGTIQWPFSVGVHIGDQIGPRSCAGCSANHGGQDFNPGLGAPIQAIADGVVSLAEDGEASLGVHMIIDHMVDGELVSSVYAHMIHGSMKFKTGDVVKVGQIIGKTGSTGMSTGPHLHFEIREGGITGTKVDPLAWLYAHTN